MAKRWRLLAAGEVALAEQVFGNSIDYGKVRIYCGLPGLPYLKVAVSPNGHIYFPRAHYAVDFSLEPPHRQVWFIHEMTHVWQHQQGLSTWLAGLLLSLRGGYIKQACYHYPPPETVACFSGLNMEQQADLLAHYFAGKCLGWPAYACRQEAYEHCLRGFLHDAGNRDLLPAYWPGRMKKNN